VSRDTAELRELLERLYAKYNRWEFIPPDPLQFIYKYSEAGEREIVGFISAVLAYGRVGQVEKSLTKLFGLMGKSPYAFVRTFGNAKRRKLSGFKHRFTTGDDVSDLLELLRKVLRQDGSIEKFFGRFCHRWMVRNDEVDAGLWQVIDKSKLIVPADVHMTRLCRILGFHSRKNISLTGAVEITEGFARIEPSDPVKYDFALSRIGILQNCRGQIYAECTQCELLCYCQQRSQ